jgi:hypothetical protein
MYGSRWGWGSHPRGYLGAGIGYPYSPLIYPGYYPGYGYPGYGYGGYGGYSGYGYSYPYGPY